MNPTMAAIRDKDDAHPLGVVGWRSEYHAMRAALDAVLALLSGYEQALDEDGSRVQFGETELRRLYGEVRGAITAHLDIEEQR